MNDNSSPHAGRTALVTGANRGLGYAISEKLAGLGMQVIVAARDLAAGEQAAAELRGRGLWARAEHLDLASPDSAAACADRLHRAGLQVDVLVNNAGIEIKGHLLETPLAAFRDSLEVNLLGALSLCHAFVPAMLGRGYGRIVNVSSLYSSLTIRLPGAAAYSVSKTALNMLTVQLSLELRGDVKANACCPGWVRTRMGGPGAPRSAEEGADTVVWLATLPADGPNGGLFRERVPLAW